MLGLIEVPPHFILLTRRQLLVIEISLSVAQRPNMTESRVHVDYVNVLLWKPYYSHIFVMDIQLLNNYNYRVISMSRSFCLDSVKRMIDT